jgi:hypothetical protein
MARITIIPKMPIDYLTRLFIFHCEHLKGAWKSLMSLRLLRLCLAMTILCSKFIIVSVVFAVIAGCGGRSFNYDISFIDSSEGLPGPDLWRENIEVVDLDMDGLPDLITPPPRYHSGEPPRIFLNRLNRWQETDAIMMPKLSFNYGWIESGPVAEGNYPSLFMNSHGSSLFALRGLSYLSWADYSPGLPASFGGKALDIGDINNDGLLDIIATMDIYISVQKHTVVFIQTLQGWTPVKDNLPPDAFGSRIRLADFNNDGLLDMAMTLSSSVENHVYQGDGGRSWRPVTGLPRYSYILDIDVADINSDGYDDLLMVYFPKGPSFNEPAVFLGSGEGFRKLPADFPPDNYSIITAGFIDCDNRMDLVFGTPQGIEIYLQKEGGSFKRALSIETPSSPRFLKLRDMNEDGSEDIVASFFPHPDARGIRVFANSARCHGARIKNISDGKTLKMGSLISVEYTSNNMETPSLRRDGKLIPLKILLSEYGRTWVVLPFGEEGQYELVLGDTAKRINLIK